MRVGLWARFLAVVVPLGGAVASHAAPSPRPLAGFLLAPPGGAGIDVAWK